MYASVVIDAVIGNDNPEFDYIIPEGMRALPGARILVPFGKTVTEGFVMRVSDTTNVPADKLKSVTRLLDDFVAIKQEFLDILNSVCDKFKLRKIDVLRLFVPSALRGGKISTLTNIFLVNKFDRAETLTHIAEISPRAKVQRALLKTFIENPVQKLATVVQEASSAVINSLVDAGYLAKESRQVQRTPNALSLKDTKSIVLTDQQQAAVKAILGGKDTFVLHGVTGSGKTEVYMCVIEHFIKAGNSAIMLVPEIGLTPQVLANFRARFGETVAIMHSGLSAGERYDEWLRLHMGDAKIALGARSAVFAPMENLGVIIIDEEHDGSYFSDSNPRFCTHDVARFRCDFNKCALVLGSATPSVETYYRATVTKSYRLLTLTTRVNDIQMPAIDLIDMTAELRGGNGGLFSRALVSRLMDTVSAGNQAMVFLNRRGFASYVTCKSCGWSAKCESCDVSLVYHKEDRMLKCHYCGGRWTAVNTCPQCSSTYLKMGATGTQKLVEELEKLLPGVPVFRMDADNTKTKDSLIEILDKFGKTSPAILVGTQMIAKGHHFPKVSLVGVVDADNSLHFSDYRAAERTFALVTQVAGRAGRDGETGHVVIQTYIPSHYVYRLAANYDYKKFFDKEINSREITKYPPFSTVARILVTGMVDVPIKQLIEKIMKTLRTRDGDFIFLGAMKSPVGRIQNKFRYQILMRFKREKESEMLDFIDKAVKAVETPRNTFVFLEINPQNLS